MRFVYENPDWPNFHWDKKALAPVLARAKEELLALQDLFFAKSPAVRERTILETLCQDTMASSAIEGEGLNGGSVRAILSDFLGFLDSGATKARGCAREEGPARMQFDATQNPAQLTQERILAWHARLLGTGRVLAGAFRTPESGTMRIVSGYSGRERVHFVAPGAECLARELERFWAWLNDEDGVEGGQDLIVRAGVAHLWFVTIHPFEDGNGRVTRAISDHILAAHDGCSKGCYSMSAQIFRVRNSYYDILERTEKGGMDITPWLSWFALCFTRAIEAGRETLARIVEGVRVLEHASAFELNERQSRVLGRLTENFQGKLTEEKYARLAKCSPVAAEADIAELIRYGILQETDESGRRPSYVLART